MRHVLQASETLTAVMSGAAATTNPKVRVQTSGGDSFIALTGATAVTLASGPCIVSGLSMNNIDTASVTVTIAHVIGGTSNVVASVAVGVGYTLAPNGDGYTTLDTTGRLLIGQGATQVVDDGIDIVRARIWDSATNTALGATPTSADDFGLTAGTFLTSDPTLRSSDAKATTVTSKARFAYTVPSTYVAGQPITLRAVAGMVTTISDTTATIDAQVVRRSAPTVDVCATNATTINTIVGGNVDFTLTPTNIVVGDVLDIVMTSAVTDGATATAVIAELRRLTIRPTVRV